MFTVLCGGYWVNRISPLPFTHRLICAIRRMFFLVFGKLAYHSFSHDGRIFHALFRFYQWRTPETDLETFLNALRVKRVERHSCVAD